MCGYAQERFEGIRGELGRFLKQSGFKDQDVAYVPWGFCRHARDALCMDEPSETDQSFRRGWDVVRGCHVRVRALCSNPASMIVYSGDSPP